MKIKIGLTGWGDHPDVYNASSTTKDKLRDYSTHFPIVELDATFYAIQPERNITKWITETPDEFQFVVKAYQGMTGHLRGRLPYTSTEEMYQLFIQSIRPLKETGKLAAILVQFPPWFDCTKENVEEIRAIHNRLEGFPVAIEFRHQSWYEPKYRQKTIAFLKSLEAIHSICDEPQAGVGSIPFVPIATRDDKVLVRIHGRNVEGWINTTGDSEAWRKVRTLYNYSLEELAELGNVIQKMNPEEAEILILFNNNSGGHASKNAKSLQKLLGLTYESGEPKQLDIFEEDW